jgi:hypothetical protein
MWIIKMSSAHGRPPLTTGQKVGIALGSAAIGAIGAYGAYQGYKSYQQNQNMALDTGKTPNPFVTARQTRQEKLNELTASGFGQTRPERLNTLAQYSEPKGKTTVNFNDQRVARR